MKAIKKIGINLGAIIIVFVLLLILMMVLLKSYTRHNVDHVEIPEIEGMRLDKAIQMLEEKGFEYEVNDTIYKDGVPLMSIVDQDPDAGFMVKPGRRIYLVINADKVPLVKMPALAGKESFRSAVILLRSSGLQLGRKIERPSPMINDASSEPVLEQRMHGDSLQIKAGNMIRRNSKIDLVVGKMIKNTSPEEELIEGDDQSEDGAE